MTKKEFEVADSFKDYINGKTFGFSQKHDSDDAEIVRFGNGVKKIEELTGKKINEFKKSEYTDDGLTDTQFVYGNIIFEYTTPADSEDFEGDGWWKVWDYSNKELNELDSDNITE